MHKLQSSVRQQFMEVPKLNRPSVDTERLVRDFLAAVNSLKASTVGFACDSSNEPDRVSCPVSKSGAAEPALLSALAEDPEAEDDEIGPDKHLIFEEFRNDHELIERLQVTPKELQALSSSALLGSLTGKADLLFILHQIRLGSEAEHAKPSALNSRPTPGQRVEESPRNLKEMTEHIRREAMARLAEPIQESAWQSWFQRWRRPRARLA